MLNVGQKVYQTDGVRIYVSRITFSYVCNGKRLYDTETGLTFDETAVGVGIFITAEEAELKLSRFGLGVRRCSNGLKN